MFRENNASLSRRHFCSRALLTSAAVMMTTTETVAKDNLQQYLLAYPPIKI